MFSPHLSAAHNAFVLRRSPSKHLLIKGSGQLYKGGPVAFLQLQ